MTRIGKAVIERAKQMKRNGKTNSEISVVLKMGKRTVVHYTAWLGPRRFMGVKRELPLGALGMNAAKAGIHAYLIAEGDLKTSKPRRNENYKRAVLEFWNSSQLLLRDFVERVERVYGYQPRVDCKRGRVELRRVEVVKDLLKYGSYSSHDWDIPSEVMNGGVALKRELVRCFGDSEGHVSKSKNEIVFKSVNLHGLRKVEQLLRDLVIPSRINGPYSNSYKLVISTRPNLEKYYHQISFINPERRRRLERLVK